MTVVVVVLVVNQVTAETTAAAGRQQGHLFLSIATNQLVSGTAGHDDDAYDNDDEILLVSRSQQK